jgi:hypothetical protein
MDCDSELVLVRLMQVDGTARFAASVAKGPALEVNLRTTASGPANTEGAGGFSLSFAIVAIS